MSACELAQLNIDVIKGPMDPPLMADFANHLERINAVAAAECDGLHLSPCVRAAGCLTREATRGFR
jgi:hypothetical protein